MSKYLWKVNLLQDLRGGGGRQRERLLYWWPQSRCFKKKIGSENNGPGQKYTAWGRGSVENWGPSK